MQAPPIDSPRQYLGQPGEDPSSPFWASGNYVGPYWSNGKVQSSVEWGDLDPFNDLDRLARMHDAAYAHFPDEKHREAADQLFADEAEKLKVKYGKKFADDPKFAAAAVRYGNYAMRQAGKLARYAVGPTPLFGALKFGVENIIEMHKRISGTHLKNELERVRKFYMTDPKLVGAIQEKNTKPMKTVVVKPFVPTKRPVETKENETRPATTTHRGGPAVGSSGKANETRPGSSTHSRVPAPGRLNPKRLQLYPEDERTFQLINNQRLRIANYKALHDAAQASIGKPRRYQRPSYDVGLALPESRRIKLRKKRNAVRPL